MELKDIVLVYESVIKNRHLLVKGKEHLESFLVRDKKFAFKSCQILVSKKLNP